MSSRHIQEHAKWPITHWCFSACSPCFSCNQRFFFFSLLELWFCFFFFYKMRTPAVKSVTDVTHLQSADGSSLCSLLILTVDAATDMSHICEMRWFCSDTLGNFLRCAALSAISAFTLYELVQKKRRTTAEMETVYWPTEYKYCRNTFVWQEVPYGKDLFHILREPKSRLWKRFAGLVQS